MIKQYHIAIFMKFKIVAQLGDCIIKENQRKEDVKEKQVDTWLYNCDINAFCYVCSNRQQKV